jgi:chromosome segregation ATPase
VKPLHYRLDAALSELTRLTVLERDADRADQLRELHAELLASGRALVKRNVQEAAVEYQAASAALDAAGESLAAAARDLAKVEEAIEKLAEAASLLARLGRLLA